MLTLIDQWCDSVYSSFVFGSTTYSTICPCLPRSYVVFSSVWLISKLTGSGHEQNCNRWLLQGFWTLWNPSFEQLCIKSGCDFLKKVKANSCEVGNGGGKCHKVIAELWQPCRVFKRRHSKVVYHCLPLHRDPRLSWWSLTPSWWSLTLVVFHPTQFQELMRSVWPGLSNSEQSWK